MDEPLEGLKIKIFFDGACNAELAEIRNNPFIKGLTTNPTLMRKEGVEDYEAFAKEMLDLIPDRPISFGVCSDDFAEMEEQALELSSWGENVFIKIPIMNTQRKTAVPLIRKLSANKIKLNVTAILTVEQVKQVAYALNPEVPCYFSIFAGRIADTGRDPCLTIKAALQALKHLPLVELIWASPRELFNIFQAEAAGCQIITITKEIYKKLNLVGYNLEDYSLDTVRMFANDAKAAGFKLPQSSV